MFPLRPGRLPANTVQNIVFITRPELSLIELVAQNVRKSVISCSFVYSDLPLSTWIRSHNNSAKIYRYFLQDLVVKLSIISVND